MDGSGRTQCPLMASMKLSGTVTATGEAATDGLLRCSRRIIMAKV